MMKTLRPWIVSQNCHKYRSTSSLELLVIEALADSLAKAGDSHSRLLDDEERLAPSCCKNFRPVINFLWEFFTRKAERKAHHLPPPYRYSHKFQPTEIGRA